MDATPPIARLASLLVLLDGEPRWADGSDVVARVVSAPREGGWGVLSLAGRELRARLPGGLEAGQKLALRVQGTNAEGELILALAGHPPGEAGASVPTHRTDGDVPRLPLGLPATATPIPLPGGGAVWIAVDPDDEAATAAEEGAHAPSAVAVLELPTLGTIELRLRLEPARLSARVAVEPRGAAFVTEEAARELAALLREAADRPAAVELSRLEPPPSQPPRPGPELLDGYA